MKDAHSEIVFLGQFSLAPTSRCLRLPMLISASFVNPVLDLLIPPILLMPSLGAECLEILRGNNTRSEIVKQVFRDVLAV